MNGEPSDSLAYCMKEAISSDDFFEHGEMPVSNQGKRNDLHDVVSRILGGEKTRDMIQEVAPAVAVVKFYRGLNHLESLLSKPRGEPPKVFWFWGPTGTGKTRTAWELASHYGLEHKDIWASLDSLKWFDGYNDHKYVIIDDFRAKQVKQFEKFLRLLDRYPWRVPVKGDYVNWNPSVIVITCPYEPRRAFETRAQHVPEDLQQLERRITGKVVHFDHLYTTHERISLCTSLVFTPTTQFPAQSNPNLVLSPPRFYDLTEAQEIPRDVRVDSDLDTSGEVLEKEPKEPNNEIDSDDLSLESYTNNEGREVLFQQISKDFWEKDGEATLSQDGYEVAQPLARRLFQLPDDARKEQEMARNNFFKKKK